MTTSPPPADPATTVHIDGELEAALGPVRAAEWRRHRGSSPAEVRVELVDGQVVAAVLTTRRRATLATKIADTWQAQGARADLAKLVETVVGDAESRGDVVVTSQSPCVFPVPTTLGFERMPAPHGPAVGLLGYRRWLCPVVVREVRHYAQTSTFTCAAVAALLALDLRGAGDDHAATRAGVVPDTATVSEAATGFDRDRELDFWRRASNYPSCEPIGLAVALRESLGESAGGAPVEVFLDAEGPVLLEAYPDGFDRSFRVELQAHSLRAAQRIGIAVRRERVTVGEIARRVAAGEMALLLIDLESLLGFTVPHWVLAHSATGGVVFLEDPWVAESRGETWVDAHMIPVAESELEGMLAWGPDGYRGVVFLHPETLPSSPHPT